MNEKLIREMDARAIAEEELHRTRQMLQMVLDNIPQRLFWKNRDFRYLGCNKAFAEHAGLHDPVDIIGMNDNQMPWRKVSEHYQTADRMVMEHDAPKLKYDVALPLPDGQLIWQHKSKLHDRDGNVIGVMEVGVAGKAMPKRR